jgi:LysR family transcriptional regulator, transcriptional activator of nhaA
MAEMNFHHLRYFHAVAHDGNLTRTAERLNLSQSAVSIQIKQLEERLGHKLFERRGRKLLLTEAGRIALDHADRIFATGTELFETLKRTGTSRRPVRIGALATLSRNFQIAFLKPLLGRVDIEIILRSGRTADLLQGLETHNFDIVLLNQSPPADSATSFISHLIATQSVSLVGGEGPAQKEADLLQRLRKYPLILPTRDSGVRQKFDAMTARHGIVPQIAAEVEDMAMMRLLSREAAGLAVLPPIVVKEELEIGRLFELDILPGVDESFYAVTMRRRFPNPLTAELVEKSAELSFA